MFEIQYTYTMYLYLEHVYLPILSTILFQNDGDLKVSVSNKKRIYERILMKFIAYVYRIYPGLDYIHLTIMSIILFQTQMKSVCMNQFYLN